MRELPAPAGGARRPFFSAAETAGRKGCLKLPLGILPGNSGKVEGVVLQPAGHCSRPFPAYPMGTEFIERYLGHNRTFLLYVL